MQSVNESSTAPLGMMLTLKTAKGDGVPRLATAKSGLDIIDIRRVAVEINLKTDVLSMFHAKNGPRELPTLLLYDERGLQLFEKVRLV